MRKNHSKIVCIKLVHLPYSDKFIWHSSWRPEGFSYCWQRRGAQYEVNSLLRFHSNTGHANAPVLPYNYIACLFILNKTRQTMYVWRNTEARSYNHCCSGRAISVTYSECVSIALIVQPAKRMRPIILSSEECLVPPYFSTFPRNRMDFWEKKILNTKFSLQPLCGNKNMLLVHMYIVKNTTIFLILRLLLLRYNYMFRPSMLAIFMVVHEAPYDKLYLHVSGSTVCGVGWVRDLFLCL